MIRRLVTGTLVASLPLLSHALVIAAPAIDCAPLVALTIPDVTINAATSVAADGFTPPSATAAMTLPAFCRVEATARPTSDSEIKFEVWIPVEGVERQVPGRGQRRLPGFDFLHRDGRRRCAAATRPPAPIPGIPATT